MKTESYVRTEMLGQKAPPATTVGIIGWVRQNLFDGWLNSILTVIGAVAVFLILEEIAPWIWRGTWTADSLQNCREVIQATYGEGVTAACWSVIGERYQQLMFGFYPSELYWRPILAFIGLLVALSPVLFSHLPRKMLWFSAIYPFLCFWLLWGGTIWFPISVLAGFAIGYAAFVLVSRTAGNLAAVTAAILVPVLWWLFLAAPVANDL